MHLHFYNIIKKFRHIILFYSDGKAEIPINLRSYLEGIPEQVR